MVTTTPQLMLVAFQALDEAEQEEAFQLISEARLERIAGEDGLTARFLRSIKRVAEHLDETPTSTSYRKARGELVAAGEEVAEVNAVIRHFGSWREAREAYELSDASSARQIDARFSRRRLGKVWRYTEETLGETLKQCAAALGHVPQVAEFEHWRERELELARAQGDDALHLPSPTPYRRRFGTWEKALLHFGFTSDEVAERLERGRGEK